MDTHLWSFDGVFTSFVNGPLRREAAVDSDGVVTRFGYDALGNTVDGFAVGSDYDAFGRPSGIGGVGGVGSSGGLGFGLRGELTVNGLTHLRARDYDASTGQFLSVDPLESPVGSVTGGNPHHYVGYVDPSGMGRHCDGLSSWSGRTLQAKSLYVLLARSTVSSVIEMNLGRKALMNSWVVVGGGAGFIGCHLVRALLESERNVVCIDDVSTGRWNNLDGLDPDRVIRLELDVRRDCTAAVRDALHSSAVVSAVCNFASPASPPAYLARPIDTLEIGSIGTKNLIDLALVHGARFLQASTSEVYGDPVEHPQHETYWGNVNPIGPRACYDEAKRFGEALCTSYERSRGLDLRLVRIFNTYGPRMQRDDGRVVTNFVGQALAGMPLTVFGEGVQTRSLCYIDDLVRGLILLLDSDLRGPLNLGSPVEVTMLELAQIVIAQTNSTSSIAFLDLPIDDPLQRQPDITRAINLLGWRPYVDLQAGLAQTISSFSEYSAHR